MGVRGLTTYIYNNSNKYFDNHKLHDSELVIDGNALASILFQNSIRNTSSFGGDYDRYANAVKSFFNQLTKCNIKPYVIFDGGYEKKKLSVVYSRNKNKMMSLSKLGPSSQSKVCFPLMMRQVFRDALSEINIVYAQCDFEADGEIAALARKLKCPVLSNDSDFFIFDVTFIPLNEFSVEADVDEEGNSYMSCLVYKVEKVLSSLGGLPKSHLPLLAAILGNDYISRSTFSNFYSQMKFCKGKKHKQIQHRVSGVIAWLKRESFESALNKILCHLKKNRKKMVAMKIAKIIEGYNQFSTTLDSYILPSEHNYSDIEVLCVEDILKEYDALNIDETCQDDINENLSESNESNTSSDETDRSSDEEELQDTPLDEKEEPSTAVRLSRSNDFNLIKSNIDHHNLPNWFIEYARQGNIPSCLKTLLSLKIYFCIPQVEDYGSVHSGEIGLPILNKIAGILLGDNVYSYYHRTLKLKYIVTKMETSTICSDKSIPLFRSFNKLNVSERTKLFLDIFEIDGGVLEIVNNFPEEWHLFIISVIYWAKHIIEPSFKSYHLNSVIIMIICIRVIESKIGYFRNKRPFMQRYASKIKKTNSKNELNNFDQFECIDDIIKAIPLEECLNTFILLLPYFQVEEKLKTNDKLFLRSFVHSIAQLQVIIDLSYTLNFLLMKPFSPLAIHNFFNATFLYNFFNNFKKRHDLTAYMDTFLVKSPTLLYLFKKMSGLLASVIVIEEKADPSRRRKKKKKSMKKYELSSSDYQHENDEEASSYSDDDNTFSLLSKLSIR